MTPALRNLVHLLARQVYDEHIAGSSSPAAQTPVAAPPQHDHNAATHAPRRAIRPILDRPSATDIR